MFIFLLVICMAIIGCFSGLSLYCLFFDKQSEMKDWWIGFREEITPTLKIYAIILLGVNLLISLFFFPVLMLLLVQLKNLCINRTTYERIRGSGKVKEQLKSKHKSRVSMQNCRTMCSNNRDSFSSSTNSEMEEQLLSN